MFTVYSPFRLRVSQHLDHATFPVPASSNAACGFPALRLTNKFFVFVLPILRYSPRFCLSMKIIYILYMRFLLRITLVLITIFFIGCQGNSFQVHSDSRQDGHFDIHIKEYEMRVTAYCPCRRCCGKNGDRKTASGHKIQRGDVFVAADRRYPFGTEIIVPGYNNSEPVKVLDRGYVIRGNRLDVFFDSHQKAREWGVKYLPVKVLTN